MLVMVGSTAPLVAVTAPEPRADKVCATEVLIAFSSFPPELPIGNEQATKTSNAQQTIVMYFANAFIFFSRGEIDNMQHLIIQMNNPNSSTRDCIEIAPFLFYDE